MEIAELIDVIKNDNEITASELRVTVAKILDHYARKKLEMVDLVAKVSMIVEAQAQQMTDVFHEAAKIRRETAALRVDTEADLVRLAEFFRDVVPPSALEKAKPAHLKLVQI